jgi:hypothetical protein
VGDIVIFVGYVDITSFARHFRDWCGMNPSRFRERTAAALDVSLYNPVGVGIVVVMTQDGASLVLGFGIKPRWGLMLRGGVLVINAAERFQSPLRGRVTLHKNSRRLVASPRTNPSPRPDLLQPRGGIVGAS